MNLGQAEANISSQTVQWVPHTVGFHACRPRRTPLLRKRNTKSRLVFAKTHLVKEWDLLVLLFYGQMKQKWIFFGHDNVAFVWCKKGDAFNPKNTVPTVKRVGWNIMLWGCSSANAPGHTPNYTPCTLSYIRTCLWHFQPEENLLVE